MRGIKKVLHAVTGRTDREEDNYASWTKRLFDSNGNEIEVRSFEKFYFIDHRGSWLREQFTADGLYWLVFNSNEEDRPYGGLWLLSVRDDRRDVGYTMLCFESAEATLAAYDTGATVDNLKVVIPDVVRDTTLELVPTRV